MSKNNPTLEALRLFLVRYFLESKNDKALRTANEAARRKALSRPLFPYSN